jgi:hypothetical protein
MNAAIVTDSTLQLTQDLIEEVEADRRISLIKKGDNIQSIVFNLTFFTRGIPTAPSIEISLPYNKNMADIAN